MGAVKKQVLHVVAVTMAILAGFMLPPSDTAQAQYIFLDANGDGGHSAADSINATTTNAVDVWIKTNQNRDGSQVICIEGVGSGKGDVEAPSTSAMTINSYEFALRAEGGTIEWGPYANAQPSMGTTLGSGSDSTQFYVGFFGLAALAPGSHKLGTIIFRVATGQPSINIAPTSTLLATAGTAFGSACGGTEGDNTLKLGTDWLDADGLSPSALTLIWTETFEDGFPVRSDGNQWWEYPTDSDTNGGLDYWWSSDVYCAYTYEGTHSVSAAGVTDLPFCFQYDNSMDASLWMKYYLDVTNYSSFSASFQARYNIGPGDYFQPFYDTNNGYGWGATTPTPYSGSTNGEWLSLGTPIILNTNHEADRFALAFKFVSDASGVTNGGAYVDDIRVYGTARSKPNLVAFAPSGWDGKIIPAMRQGTTRFETLVGGGTTYIDWAVKNTGAANAGVFDITYYIDDAYLTSERVYGGLAAGGEHYLLDYSTTLSEGSHKLEMHIDDFGAGEVDEANENDNTYEQYFYWNPPAKPDLIVSSPVTVSNQSPSLGDVVTVTATIRNQGTASTGTGFAVALFNTRATPPTVGSVADQVISVGALGGNGGTTTVTFNVQFSSVADWSTFIYVDAGIDADGAISESAEGNNVAGPAAIHWRGGVFTVHGYFVYDDSTNNNQGTNVPCSRVEVWHDDVVDSLLGTGWINGADGSYQIGPITNADATPPAGGNGILDVYVKWVFESIERCFDLSYPYQPVVSLKVGNLENLWGVATTTRVDMPNATYEFGLVKPTDYGHRSAAHIFDRVQRIWQYFSHVYRAIYGTPGPVTVRWVPGYQINGSHYNDVTRTIYLDGTRDPGLLSPDEWDNYAIAHEYGHHLLDTLGGFEEIGDSLGTHSLYAPANSLRQAWSEGFAGLVGVTQAGNYSGTARNYGQGVDGTQYWQEVNLEEGSVQYHLAGGDGWFTRNEAGPKYELAVAATLWDVGDNISDNPNNDQFWDRYWGGWGAVWQIPLKYSSGLINNFCDYEKHLMQQWCCDVDDNLMQREVFREHGMFCDAAWGPTAVEKVDNEIRTLALRSPAPNPFNPNTRLRFELPKGEPSPWFALRVFDVTGRLVRTLAEGKGRGGAYEVPWDGTGDDRRRLAAGVYYCRLTYGSQERTQRLTLLK